MTRPVLIALLVGAFSTPLSAQSIFDNVSSQNPYNEVNTLWKFGNAGADDEYVYRFATLQSQFIDSQCSGESGSSGKELESSSNVTDSTGQVIKLTCRFTSYRINSFSGARFDEQPNRYTESTVSNRDFNSLNCGQDANGATNYTFKSGNLCYDPAELGLVDSCETSDVLPPDGSTGDVCRQKSDGSMCLFENTTTDDGVPYLQMKINEGTTCYTNDLETFDDTPFNNPNSEACQDIGQGVVACAENPANVCTGGVCQSGCGSYDIGQGETFVCFSNDTDSDGIGDYADPDIDGDGIPNASDLDADGDGQDDPDYGNGAGSGGGGGSVTIGEIVVNVDNSGIEQRLDSLVEQTDFDESEVQQGLDNIEQEFDNKVTEFMDSDALKFDDVAKQTGYEDDYSSIQNILSPTSCSASFTIPFSTNSLDLCEPIGKAQPFLYVIFGVGTFIYCVRRIFSAVGSKE